MESLLEILNREQTLINELRLCNHNIRLCTELMYPIQGIDIGSKAKDDELEMYALEIKKAHAQIDAIQVELSAVRNKLRKHLKIPLKEET